MTVKYAQNTFRNISEHKQKYLKETISSKAS